jgi:excisionase family DNA binding protein
MTDVRLLSRPEVAERLGKDVRTVRKMIALRQLPVVRVGSRDMVPAEAVEKFVQDVNAMRIGTETGIRLFIQIMTALQEAPHVTGEDGR